MNKHVNRMFGDQDLTGIIGEGQDAMRNMCTKLGAYVYDLMEEHDITPWELDSFLSDDRNWELMKLWERDDEDDEYCHDEQQYDRNLAQDIDEVDWEELQHQINMGPKTQAEVEASDEDTIIKLQDDLSGIPPIDESENQVIEDLTDKQTHVAFEGARKRHMASTEISDEVVSDVNVDDDLRHEAESQKQAENEAKLESDKISLKEKKKIYEPNETF